MVGREGEVTVMYLVWKMEENWKTVSIEDASCPFLLQKYTWFVLKLNFNCANVLYSESF